MYYKTHTKYNFFKKDTIKIKDYYLILHLNVVFCSPLWYSIKQRGQHGKRGITSLCPPFALPSGYSDSIAFVLHIYSV